MAAFKLALLQGADGIELDVQLSADGQVVVIHDQTVDRTTQGKGHVRDLTLTQLRMLDAGSHFDIAYQGEPIPLLDEVFATFGHRTLLNIELKSDMNRLDKLPEKTIDLVKFYHLTSQVLISSFNPIALRTVKALAPEIAIGLLVMPGFPGAWARSRIGRYLVPYDSLHLPLKDIKSKPFSRITRSTQRILVYSVNDPADMKEMYELNIRGIITDDPQLARKTLSTHMGVHSELFPSSQKDHTAHM